MILAATKAIIKNVLIVKMIQKYLILIKTCVKSVRSRYITYIALPIFHSVKKEFFLSSVCWYYESDSCLKYCVPFIKVFFDRD